MDFNIKNGDFIDNSAHYTVENFTLTIGRKMLIENLNITVNAGDLFLISGENGTGKSTLMKSIIGDKTTIKSNKSVSIHGNVIKNFNSRSYLAQNSTIDRSFPINVYDVARMGLFHKKKQHCEEEQVMKCLRQLKLSEKALQSIQHLSGGEIQRLRFSHIILQNADSIFLDEPFVNIDIETIQILVEMIMLWKTNNKSITIITHDAVDEIQNKCDKILKL